MEADLGTWEPFDVATVVARLANASVLWWLSGGEALDLFLERATRAHADIDVSVRRSDWPKLRSFLAGRLEVKIAHNGVLSEVSDQPLDPAVNGLWARDIGGGPWRVQINLEPIVGADWVFRRDTRIRRPVDEVVWRRGPLRYVNPAVQLLWKVADPRPKDEHDFAAVVPSLPPDERQWLTDAIERCYPASPLTRYLRGGQR